MRGKYAHNKTLKFSTLGNEGEVIFDAAWLSGVVVADAATQCDTCLGVETSEEEVEDFAANWMLG